MNRIVFAILIPVLALALAYLTALMHVGTGLKNMFSCTSFSGVSRMPEHVRWDRGGDQLLFQVKLFVPYALVLYGIIWSLRRRGTLLQQSNVPVRILAVLGWSAFGLATVDYVMSELMCWHSTEEYGPVALLASVFPLLSMAFSIAVAGVAVYAYVTGFAKHAESTSDD